MQTACGIEYNNVVTVVLCVGNSLLRYFAGVNLPHFKHRNINLASHHFKLVDSRRTVHVAGHKQRALAHLFEMKRKLAGMGGFTGALKADHHNDGGYL